jgi:hypothetical protein
MNKLQVFFNALLTIFTGALVVTGYLQWNALQQSLTVTERAYLWATLPYIDGTQIRIPLENGGKIPSPKVKVSYHLSRERVSDRATLESADGSFGGDRTNVPPGTGHYGIGVPMKGFAESDAASVKNGTEIVFVAGNIDYDDGFGVQTQNSYCFKEQSCVQQRLGRLPNRNFCRSAKDEGTTIVRALSFHTSIVAYAQNEVPRLCIIVILFAKLRLTMCA